mmetsp:Transcript_31479/g.46439  ORF Transcript_31479/g.46439 Transcript_31479/m.46439 type:complete len:154 (+) Transcript_31479:620-1081(+)
MISVNWSSLLALPSSACEWMDKVILKKDQISHASEILPDSRQSENTIYMKIDFEWNTKGKKPSSKSSTAGTKPKNSKGAALLLKTTSATALSPLTTTTIGPSGKHIILVKNRVPIMGNLHQKSFSVAVKQMKLIYQKRMTVFLLQHYSEKHDE